ncbi:MAG TPA: T9SS type A sorting domain-containing protein, partial [Saprospiraceae bacterium]|nr:T9SS type A sorting domain-containing protein [Saprospiraceae bacterium]
PNPTHHQMMVKSNEFIHYIKISSIAGKTIRTIHFNKPEYQIELDTKMLANGLYILEMNSGISRQTVKFEKTE